MGWKRRVAYMVMRNACMILVKNPEVEDLGVDRGRY